MPGLKLPEGSHFKSKGLLDKIKQLSNLSNQGSSNPPQNQEMAESPTLWANNSVPV